MKESISKKFILFGTYSILIFFAFVCLYPLFWLLLSSFKTNDELFVNPWGLPNSLDFTNYIVAFVQGNIGSYFLNSVFVSVIAVTITLVLSSMVSYAIARMIWKNADRVMNLFLLGMMIPIYATIIPLFSMFKGMNVLDTYVAVIIPNIVFGFPTAIFILTGFFKTIPRDIEEAAVMDGCGIFRIFFQIIMPISKSSIVTVVVIIFMGVWNDLLLPQIFLSSPEKMTLPVALSQFQGMYSIDYVSLIAAVVLTIIPSIIIYILLHKNIMEGMVSGAVKG